MSSSRSRSRSRRRAKPNPPEGPQVLRVVLAAVAIGAVGYGVYRFARKSSLSEDDLYSNGYDGGYDPYRNTGFQDNLDPYNNSRLPDGTDNRTNTDPSRGNSTPRTPPLGAVPVTPGSRPGQTTVYVTNPVGSTPPGQMPQQATPVTVSANTGGTSFWKNPGT